MGGTSLRLEEVLKDNNTHDPSAVSTLKLNNKALSQVSCLSEFKNLEKLDLTFNNLTSVEGLKSCFNLKWLSVVQNKLESLKGIEGLSKLTVLNAGKNKIRSMDEVRSLGNLCALILNDNEIVSICKLEQMKKLNTLVLSRNPIRDIGESLMKVTSMKKLSLSHCKLQSIDSSLKSCVELKELRLSHNEIMALPADLMNNKRLQSLDFGYNVITRSSDLKVLNSLVNLRNINLQGNPIAENIKFVKKIQKALPNLQIFNARPVDKRSRNEKGGADEDDHYKQGEGNASMKKSFERQMVKNKGSLQNTDEDPVEKVKRKRQKPSKDASEELVEKEDKRGDQMRKKKSRHEPDNAEDLDKGTQSNQEIRKNKDKNSSNKQHGLLEENGLEIKNKSNKPKRRNLDVIDDPDASFTELFAADVNVGSKDAENNKYLLGYEVMIPTKFKKGKKQERITQVESSSIVEVGMGGTSTWGDE